MKYTFCVFTITLLGSNTICGQSIEWTQKQSMPFACRNGRAISCSNKIYFMGGYSSSTKKRFAKSVYEYDPEEDTWKQKTDMLTGRSNFALVEFAEKIYAIGGDPFSPKNEMYDPAVDSWVVLKPMLTPRQHVNGVSVNGKIYVIGGLMDVKNDSIPAKWSYKNISSKNEVYNPVSDSWEELAPMPTPRHDAYIASVDGKIYVIGGMGDKSNIWKPLPVVEMYDPVTNTWETRAPLPSSRDGFGISVINEMIYIVGGWSESGIVNTVNFYDPKSDKWNIISEFPNKKNGAAGCATIGNRIYIIGGCDDKFTANSNVFVGTMTVD